MKKWAFILLVSVIGSHMLIVTGVLYGCFNSKAERCTGEKISELMTMTLANAFALYAAEK